MANDSEYKEHDEYHVVNIEGCRLCDIFTAGMKRQSELDMTRHQEDVERFNAVRESFGEDNQRTRIALEAVVGKNAGQVTDAEVTDTNTEAKPNMASDANRGTGKRVRRTYHDCKEHESYCDLHANPDGDCTCPKGPKAAPENTEQPGPTPGIYKNLERVRNATDPAYAGQVTDAEVKAAADAYAAALPPFGNENYFSMLKAARCALEAAVGDRLARAARMEAALKEVRAECIVVGREPILDGDDARELIREITSILTEAGE